MAAVVGAGSGQIQQLLLGLPRGPSLLSQVQQLSTGSEMEQLDNYATTPCGVCSKQLQGGRMKLWTSFDSSLNPKLFISSEG